MRVAEQLTGVTVVDGTERRLVASDGPGPKVFVGGLTGTVHDLYMSDHRGWFHLERVVTKSILALPERPAPRVSAVPTAAWLLPVAPGHDIISLDLAVRKVRDRALFGRIGGQLLGALPAVRIAHRHPDLGQGPADSSRIDREDGSDVSKGLA